MLLVTSELSSVRGYSPCFVLIYPPPLSLSLSSLVLMFEFIVDGDVFILVIESYSVILATCALFLEGWVWAWLRLALPVGEVSPTGVYPGEHVHVKNLVLRPSNLWSWWGEGAEEEEEEGGGGKRSQEASVSNWKSQIFQLGRKSYTPLPSSLCWLDQVDWLEVCLASGCRVLSSLGFSRSNLSRFFRDELSGCRRRIVYTASNIHGTAAVVNAKASRGNPIFRQEKKRKR